MAAYSFTPACTGNWALVVKRDIFNKVRGAVRIVPLLEEQALAEKVRIALEGAAAYREGEATALQQVVDIAGEDLVQLLNATLAQQYEGGCMGGKGRHM